jgi:hypothetical protein
MSKMSAVYDGIWMNQRSVVVLLGGVRGRTAVAVRLFSAANGKRDGSVHATFNVAEMVRKATAARQAACRKFRLRNDLRSERGIANA